MNLAKRWTAFTLIELLVVVAIIALLIGVLIPALSRARETSRMAVCGSNVRQIALANTGYAIESRGHYVRAAADIFNGFGGTKRWHGQRLSAGVSPDPLQNTFDPAIGPLVDYLGVDGQVKACPSFADFITDGALNAFERGNGGYGYNRHYVGGRSDRYGDTPQAAAMSARQTDVHRPADTIMFTDTAFITIVGGAKQHIEYSFAEPPFFQTNPGAPSTSRANASIHFRHLDNANVAWVDGHVRSEPIVFNRQSISAGGAVDPSLSLGLGWFGDDSNDVFDLR